MLQRGFAARLFLLSTLGGGLVAATVSNAAEPPAAVALVRASHGVIEWTPLVESDGMTLALADPQGVVRTLQFAPGEAPALSLFDKRGMPLPDGTYTWELRLTRHLSNDLKRQIEEARRHGDEGQLANLKRLSAPLLQSGYFTLAEGNLIPSDLPEQPEHPSRQGSTSPSTRPTAKDQVVPDDLIVDGKGCIGLGCANGESFGAEALRLKQSVVRLRFEDTSATAGFPTRDWQLTINDPGSGGADRFSVDDLTAGTTPFTIRGAAPSNSLYMDGLGNIGIGTATPAQDVHIASGNTPTLRFEQTAGTVHTWDVGASDVSFFVKDVTNASAVPFRVNAGAATGSLEIANTGFVGVGTTSPTTRLHFRSTDPTTSSFAPSKFLVENASSTTAPREIFEVRNNGDAAYIFKNTVEAERWYFGTFAHNFIIDNQAHTGVEYFFGPTGNITLAGTLTQNSDRTTKTDIQLVDPKVVLAQIAELPISTWRKIGETSTHLGPMAQDFRATFGLGEDERHIAPGDLAGVSLAAVQGLNAKLEEQQRTIKEQQEVIRQLEERLARLEEKR
jgi:hypothetical protein